MFVGNCLKHCAVVLLAGLFGTPFAIAQTRAPQHPRNFPWSDSKLSPDLRADSVIKEMTLDEKILLLHGHGMPFFAKEPTDSNSGAGYTPAIPRLGIPAIQRPTLHTESHAELRREDIQRRCQITWLRPLRGVRRLHSITEI